MLLSDIKAEHFDVVVGWLQTCCSREREVFKVAGYEVEWVSVSFLFYA